jgi:hypothetical protein
VEAVEVSSDFVGLLELSQMSNTAVVSHANEVWSFDVVVVVGYLDLLLLAEVVSVVAAAVIFAGSVRVELLQNALENYSLSLCATLRVFDAVQWDRVANHKSYNICVYLRWDCRRIYNFSPHSPQIFYRDAQFGRLYIG